MLTALWTTLATLRLTRFVTTDKLGDWWIVQPAKQWAYSRERPEHEGWRTKIAEATECKWCVGFWIGVLVMLGQIIAPRIPVVRHVWQFTLMALSLNVVANAVGEKLGTLD